VGISQNRTPKISEKDDLQKVAWNALCVQRRLQQLWPRVPWNQEAMGGHHPNPKRGDRWKKWKFQSRSSIMFKLIWEAVIRMGGERKINNFDVNWLWTLFLTNTSGSYQFL